MTIKKLHLPVTTYGQRPPITPIAEIGNDPAKGTNGGRLKGGHKCCPICGWRIEFDGFFMRIIGELHGKQKPWPRRITAWDWCPECAAWWPSAQKLSRGMEIT